MKTAIPEADRVKALRKPLPKTLHAWLAEFVGIAKLIDQRPRLKDANGIEWWKSTCAYNRARIVVLGENPPGNFPKAGANAMVRWILEETK